MPAEECAIMRACRARETVVVDDDIFIGADGTELEVAYPPPPSDRSGRRGLRDRFP